MCAHMCMRACTYVCMYVPYVCTIRTHIHTRKYKPACTCVRTCMCTYIHVYTHILCTDDSVVHITVQHGTVRYKDVLTRYVKVRPRCVCAHTAKSTRRCTYVHELVSTYGSAYFGTCAQARPYVRTCAYAAYPYTNACMHACMHTYKPMILYFPAGSR